MWRPWAEQDAELVVPVAAAAPMDLAAPAAPAAPAALAAPAPPAPPAAPVPNPPQPQPAEAPAPAAPGGRGITLHKQARVAIYNAYRKKKDGRLRNAIRATADEQMISERTMRRIAKDGPVTPKKRGRKDGRLQETDNFTEDMISRIIYNFYKRGISPTVDEVYHKLKQDDPTYPYKRTNFYRSLRNMGMEFKKLDNRNYIKQTPRLKKKRRIYLNQIEQARAEGNVIVFLDETWYDSHDIKKKGFTDGSPECNMPFAMSARGQRIIILHAGTEEGFLGGCLYLACKNIKDAKADYHQEMTAAVFEAWFKEVLLPTLAAQFPGRKCSIVMDNASYHSRLRPGSKIPVKGTNKTELLNFMRLHDIPVPEPRPRPRPAEQARPELANGARRRRPQPPRPPRQPTNDELFEVVVAAVRQKNIPQSYVCDTMARDAGYEVIRLPAYHCEYNPIEMAWSQLKRLVQKRNSTPSIGASVVELIRTVTAELEQQDWRGYCRHCLDVENKDRAAAPRHVPVVANLADSDEEAPMSDEEVAPRHPRVLINTQSDDSDSEPDDPQALGESDPDM